MNEKRNRIWEIIFSIFSIPIIAFLFFSVIKNRFLGLLSVFGLPLIWFFVARTYTKVLDNRIWLRTIITGLIFNVISFIIFVMMGLGLTSYTDHNAPFVQATVIYIGLLVHLAGFLFFLFYGSWIDFIKMKKTGSLVRLIILGSAILIIFTFSAFGVYSKYATKFCDSKYEFDNVNCVVKKCAMAPRNPEKCIIEKSKKNIYYCSGLMTATETLYGLESSTGAQKFVNCAKQYFLSTDSHASSCKSVKGRMIFESLCYTAYLQTNKTLTCEDVEFISGTFSDEGALTYLQLSHLQFLCTKDIKGHQSRCAYVKSRFTRICEPGSSMHGRFKDRCVDFNLWYDKYC